MKWKALLQYTKKSFRIEGDPSKWKAILQCTKKIYRSSSSEAGEPDPAGRLCSHAALAQGQMGSALMGSLQISCFLTEWLFWGTPVNLCLSSQKCQGVPFSPIRQKLLLCSGPISADPICPRPRCADFCTRSSSTR